MVIYMYVISMWICIADVDLHSLLSVDISTDSRRNVRVYNLVCIITAEGHVVLYTYKPINDR